MRLLLFSALEAPLPAFARTDITFPAQIEVRINGDEVKANYKGLKNKPGSTRPADITEFVRISPANYRNNLVVTYALTHKAGTTQYEVFFIPVSSPCDDILLTSLPEVQLIHIHGEEALCSRSHKANRREAGYHEAVRRERDEGQGSRPRHRGWVKRHVVEGPHFDTTNQHAMQIDSMHTQPVLRR